MTLSKFYSGRLALLAVLLNAMLLTPVLAVELVGKPAAMVNSASSTSAAAVDDKWVEKGDLDQAEDRVATVMAPQLNQPFGIDKHFDTNGENPLVQLMAIFFCVGGPIVLIIVLVAMHYRAKQRRAENINANIERLLAAGRDIPLELLRGDEPHCGDDSVLLRDDMHLHKGIKNVCLGVGLFVCLTIIFGIEFGAIGFIVLSIGVSQLWLWKLSGSKREKIQNQG